MSYKYYFRHFYKIVSIFGLYTLVILFYGLKIFAADEKFPLARFYLESDTSYSIDYNQKAIKSCKIEVDNGTEGIDVSSANQNRFNEIKKWCQHDNIFYRFRNLKVSDCEWEDQNPESPIKSLGPFVEQMKKGFAIKNLEVLFQNKFLICRGDLLVPGVEKATKIEGLCAPVNSSKISAQGLPDFNKNPIISFFKLEDRSSALQKSIDSMVKFDKEKLSLKISLAIPVPWKISQDISYLLSEQGMKKCDSVNIKNEQGDSSPSSIERK